MMAIVDVDRKAFALRQLKRRLSKLQVDEEVFGDYLLGVMCDSVDDGSDESSSVDTALEFLAPACNDVDGARDAIEELWDNLTSDMPADSFLETNGQSSLLHQHEDGEADISCSANKNTSSQEETSKPVKRTNEKDDSPARTESEGVHVEVLTSPFRCETDHKQDTLYDDRQLCAGEEEEGWYVEDELYPELTGEFAEWLAQENFAEDDGTFWCSYGEFDSHSAELTALGCSSVTKASREKDVLSALFNNGDLARRAYRTDGTAFDAAQRPCLFFMSGSCLRADCSFSHDVSLTTCRYWAAGDCLKGDSCPFMHAFPESNSVTQQDGGGVTLGVDDFPTLPTHEIIKWKQVDYGRTDKPMFNDLVKKGKPMTAMEASKTLSAEVSSSRSMPGARPAPVRWVPTGDVVGQQYSELRHEALKHGSLRNKYFQQATQAYSAGDKASAKHLSRRGRYHDRQMRLMNEQAARETVTQRNKQQANNVLDLHGLHIQEALACVDYFLSLDHSKRCVYLITGTGHHSVQTRYQPRLQPAVVKHICELGLSFRDCSSDGRGGMLEVVLSK